MSHFANHTDAATPMAPVANQKPIDSRASGKTAGTPLPIASITPAATRLMATNAAVTARKAITDRIGQLYNAGGCNVAGH